MINASDARNKTLEKEDKTSKKEHKEDDVHLILRAIMGNAEQGYFYKLYPCIIGEDARNKLEKLGYKVEIIKRECFDLNSKRSFEFITKIRWN